MRLDGQEPIVSIGLTAGLDGDEAGAESRGDRRIGNGGKLQVAIAVADAGDGSDDGGGASAESFGEFSAGVSGEKFVNGDLALFGGDAHFAKQGQSGVARDSGKDGAAQRRSDGFAVENEKDIHDAGFFDVAALDAVEPENILKAFFLRESRGEESASVVTSSFAVAGAAGEGADEALFGEQADGLREIRADGARHHDEAETIGGANEESVVHAEVGWPDIEGAAFAMGDPIAIEADEFLDAFEEERLWNFGHGQARGGAIQTREIFARPKERDSSRRAMGLEAFENGLAVMKRSKRGGKGDRAEWNNLGLLPGVGFPISGQHVVAEGGAELRIFSQGFRETRLRDSRDGDRCGHRASQKKERAPAAAGAPTDAEKIEKRENSCYFAALALTPL